jgi:hypothetical protein
MSPARVAPQENGGFLTGKMENPVKIARRGPLVVHKRQQERREKN